MINKISFKNMINKIVLLRDIFTVSFKEAFDKLLYLFVQFLNKNNQDW